MLLIQSQSTLISVRIHYNSEDNQDFHQVAMNIDY